VLCFNGVKVIILIFRSFSHCPEQPQRQGVPK
jgi:hypothetical protein